MNQSHSNATDTAKTVIGDRLNQGDEADHTDLMRRAFGRDADLAAWLRASVGHANTRVVRRGGKVIASTAFLPLGLSIRGCEIPAVGIANVAVLPEKRGSAWASRLIDAALAEFRAEGVALAVLFSDAVPVYRSMGFEPAGWRFRWATDPARFDGLRAPPPLDLDAGETAKVIRDLNRAAARHGNGRVIRSETLWRRKTHPYRQIVDAYVFPGLDGAPAGYALVHHHDLKLVEIKDWVALDPVAAAGIGQLIATTRSTTERVTWDGGPDDALWRIANRAPIAPEYVRQFLIRVLDPPRALAGRGWPAGVTTALGLAVEGFDPLTLTVADGTAAVAAGAGGHAVLHVTRNGFGPLFTGQRSATDLSGFGLVSGSPGVLALADTLFAAPPPWMTDEF